MNAPSFAPLGALSSRPLRAIGEPTKAPRPRRLRKQERRRLNFIRMHRLSHAEAVDIPAGFDPGPEYDETP